MIKKKETIIRLLTALFPDIKIYLFGSRARGDNRPGSDIDLAINIGRELTLEELAQTKNVLEAVNIPFKIDIVDMHNIPGTLLNIIKKEGISWKN